FNHGDDLMLSKTGFTHSDLLRWQSEYAGRSLNVNGSIMRDTYSTTGLYINFKTKTFGMNGNVVIDADSKASHATGFELGMVNNKVILPTDFNGFDSVSMGDRQGTAAVYGRNTKPGNNWQNGVRMVGASVACFYAGVGTEGTIPPRGFVNAGSQEGFLSYSSVDLLPVD
ncbi:hypothetical protein CFM96_28075, partial [Klebsiella michiganensis]|nr:hypothetical protein [Klebsiella michiganensis]